MPEAEGEALDQGCITFSLMLLQYVYFCELGLRPPVSPNYFKFFCVASVALPHTEPVLLPNYLALFLVSTEHHHTVDK